MSCICVHLRAFGKADGLACKTLDAGAQRQMLPFDFLRLALESIRMGTELE